MEFPESVRRRTFRQLVALFAVSLIYDLAWFAINRDVEEDESGGVEKQVEEFSRKISYVSFVFRVSNYLSANHIHFLDSSNAHLAQGLSRLPQNSKG